MSANTFVALLMFLLPLAYSPGAGNAFFAAIGASKGLRAAVPALAGYHVATFVVTAFIGLGMGVTILNHPVVAKALSVFGSLYVLWLAFSFIRAARPKAAPRTESVPPKEQRIGFWAGAIVLLLNPKAYYILAVMFTQFLRPSVDDNVLTVLAITTVFTLNNLIAFIVWALGGRALTTLFRSERSRRWIDYLFAATLFAVAIWMAVPLFT
jgi:threonine/homoserine/homoserine lactone efflux protein